MAIKEKYLKKREKSKIELKKEIVQGAKKDNHSLLTLTKE